MPKAEWVKEIADESNGSLDWESNGSLRKSIESSTSKSLTILTLNIKLKLFGSKETLNILYV
jgi:hypothetical protein